MKVLLYTKDYDKVKQSGVGKAIDHQIKALETVGCDYTLDENDSYDVVHINTILPNSVTFADKAKKDGKKVIYHAHSTKEDFKDSFILSNQIAPAFKVWLTYCYNKGDLIITPSEYSKRILESYKLKKDIEVVSNGIDLDFWKRKENDWKNFYNKYGLDKNKKTIISVGLPIKRKGIDDFIALAKRMPEYEFIWFGELNPSIIPPEINKDIDTAPANLHFPGYINSDDLREAYCGSDLYVFLTHEETEGIVLLEALACKADILIRDIEIFEDEYEDGINIYKADGILDFEKKIRQILEGELKSLSEVAYKIAEEKSIENTGKKLVACYKKVMNLWDQYYIFY